MAGSRLHGNRALPPHALQEFPAPDDHPRAENWQTSFGIQRQFGATIAVEADYVYTKGTRRKGHHRQREPDVQPGHGRQLSRPNAHRRVCPSRMGVVSMSPHTGKSELHALQTAFTKRYSNRWQASATYTLAGLWNAESSRSRGSRACRSRRSPTSAVSGGSQDDQRHRVVFNGIWQVGYGFQVSGLHYFGAGNRRRPTTVATCASSARAARRVCVRTALSSRATASPSRGRTRPTFVCNSECRCPDRLARRDRRAFNVFNRERLRRAVQESSANYGKPASGQYRTGQARLPLDLLIDTRQVTPAGFLTSLRGASAPPRPRHVPSSFLDRGPSRLTVDRRPPSGVDTCRARYI